MASIVLIESYYGGSHRAWADNWVEHSRHDIDLVTLPDEFWRWRLRGGAVTLAERFHAHVHATGKPDAVVVSGLLDVAAFAGIARADLRGVPLAVYVHESQLLYPLAPNQRSDSAAALTNWTSLHAADAVWFNSAFHRDALGPALHTLLDAQPAPTHSHLIESVLDPATVLWPGVRTLDLIAGERRGTHTPLVLWNQRWDHDKNPQSVFSALAAMAEDGIAFEVALAGQNQRPDNPDFAWLVDALGDRIVHSGFLPSAQYQELLLKSDVVVSAADHEFFGIALVEAMAAGAVPVLPHRLSFPELVDPQWHEGSLYGDGMLRARLREVLVDIDAARDRVPGLRQSMARFDVSASAAAHDLAVDTLVG